MEERHAGSIDDLFKQMEEDELTDRAETLAKLTPIEYAKLHSMAPQKVYYAIRNGKLEKETCICGRKVIDVAAADELFGFKKDPTPEDDNNDDETETDN